ncbi:MAG TPA: hypothetical protein VNS50_01835 [Ginsengibacter sp.]|nr:hypothetical protein [Ginsengibacter sp.]
MKKISILSLFFLYVLSSFSQTVDMTGRKFFEQTNSNVIYTFQYTEIKGTPFLSDRWMKGKAFLDREVSYDNLQIKLDLYNNKFIINWHDTSFQISTTVKQVELFPTGDTVNAMVFRNGYSVTAKINAETYLQVLTDGKLTFLKYIKKEMNDFSEYSDATKYKRFEETDKYFIFANGEFREIALNKKSLQDILPDKWNEVEDYLTKYKVNVKVQEGWRLAIQYYNSL